MYNISLFFFRILKTKISKIALFLIKGKTVNSIFCVLNIQGVQGVLFFSFLSIIICISKKKKVTLEKHNYNAELPNNRKIVKILKWFCVYCHLRLTKWQIFTCAQCYLLWFLTLICICIFSKQDIIHKCTP